MFLNHFLLLDILPFIFTERLRATNDVVVVVVHVFHVSGPKAKLLSVAQ